MYVYTHIVWGHKFRCSCIHIGDICEKVRAYIHVYVVVYIYIYSTTGGPAFANKLLKRGDIIAVIGGRNVRGMSVMQVCVLCTVCCNAS